jgi:hypothetical protein
MPTSPLLLCLFPVRPFLYILAWLLSFQDID